MLKKPTSNVDAQSGQNRGDPRRHMSNRTNNGTTFQVLASYPGLQREGRPGTHCLRMQYYVTYKWAGSNQELMSGEAAKERVTPVPSKS